VPGYTPVNFSQQGKFRVKLSPLTLQGDNRRAFRSVGGSTDWDQGFWKLECGNNEYVYATSQDTNTHQIHGVACASSTGVSNTCHTATIDNGEWAGVGDWDVNYNKGECASNEYLAGLSVDPGTGLPHQLLCCAR